MQQVMPRLRIAAAAAVVVGTLVVVAADMLAAVADTGNRQLLNRAAELNGSAALHLRLHSRTLY